MKLKFRNGKFTILILADIHMSGVEWKWTKKHIEAAINKSQPDLVVLLGDNITGRYPGVSVEKVNSAIKQIGQMFEKRNIPFTFVFGNHDHEGLCELGLTERTAKEHILSRFSAFSCCLAEKGENMTGLGNYNRLIYDSFGEKPLFNLWFMDSNPYAPENEGGGYGYVHRDQLDWYEKTAEKLKKENAGKPLPSFLFQHIIMPEIYEVLTKHKKRVRNSVKGHGKHSESYYTMNEKYFFDGTLREGPCPPDVASEQFASVVKTGDIIAVFFGHDHINDFSCEYNGIKLHQVPSTGFYSYGNNQGSRIITLSENDLKTYKTEVLHCKDICNVGLRNPFVKKHGYHQWRIFRGPAVCALFAVLAILLITGIILL